MDKLTVEGRQIHELLRGELNEGLDLKLLQQGEGIIQSVTKMLKEATEALDGLISNRIDGARDEFNLDMEQIREELGKVGKMDAENLQCSPSSSRGAGQGREARGSDPLHSEKGNSGGRHQRSTCLHEEEVRGNHTLLMRKFIPETLLFINLFAWLPVWNCPILMEVILDCGKVDVRIVSGTGALLTIDGFLSLHLILKDLQLGG